MLIVIFSIAISKFSWGTITPKDLLKTLLFILILAPAIAYTWNYLYSSSEFFSTIIDDAVLGKTGSESFNHRITADLHAMQLFFDSYGLGVGLGSNRPSSLITYLLSNVGIIGTSLFALTLWEIIRRRDSDGKGIHFINEADDRDFQAVQWGFATMIVAQCVAIPDSSFPWLWLFAGMVVLMKVDVSRRAIVAHDNLWSAPSAPVAAVRWRFPSS